MITRLSDAESYALLRAGRIARLGCVADGEPYVVPVNYAFNDESVIIHSLPGRKITAMRAAPRVCLQVDDIKNGCRWKSVLAYGTFEELNNPAERSRALNYLLSAFPQLTPVESLIAEDAAPPPLIVFRIRIDRVTGVKEG